MELNAEQEKALLAKYQVSQQDAIDFETFYVVYLDLTAPGEITEQDASKSEYSMNNSHLILQLMPSSPSEVPVTSKALPLRKTSWCQCYSKILN